MDFFEIGSMSSYIKNLGLANKWKIKKNTNDFTNDEKKTELQRKNDMFKQTYMDQKKKEEKSEALTNIHNKINAGAKLTPDEMKYLQENDPQMYQKLKALENEKKQFEKDLRRCKTKEDVEKLKFSKVSAAMSSISSVKNNPNIPEGFKLGVAAFEMRKLGEFDKIAAKFVKSGEYEKLPTEAEKRKAEHDIKEAEAAETEKILHKEEKTDSPEKTDDSDNQNESEKADSDVKTETDSETTQTDNAEKAVESIENEKSPAVTEKDITRTEAELTPEAKKVKYAKAKAAYKKSVIPEAAPASEITFKNTQINSVG